MNSKKIILSIFASVFLFTSCDDNDTETVDNTTLPPSAQPFNAEHVMGTLTYNFSISDDQAASNGTGAGVAYSWDFNGEATAVAPSGSHTFSSRGLKTVTLTVTTTALDGTTTLSNSYSMDMNVERSLYGDVTSDLDLSGDYVLSGQLQVRDGATLTIAAGSNIYALSDDGNGNAPAIVVWQGGMIEAVGTANAPIIMTSIIARDEPDRLPIVGGRAWGGLIVCGYAPIQGGGTRTVEGVASVPYGGTDAADDSGTLRYVSVRYGGRAIAPDNEINGITLAGVGTGTEVSYCEVAYNFDDGFEMFGGTVDLRYCMVYKVGDDGFDTDTGYQGTGQFLVVVRGATSNRGHEMDGRNSSQSADDSFPKFSNVTIVGNNSGSSEDESLRLREGTAGHFQNYMLVDQQRRGFRATNEDGNLDGTFVVNGSTPPTNDADGRYIWLDPLNVMDDVPTPATVAATDGTDPGASFTFNVQDGNTGVTEANLLPTTEFTGSTPTEASMDASATFVGALKAGFNDDAFDGWTVWSEESN